MKAQRENRIDLLRGLCLLLIFIGHAEYSFSEGFRNSRGFSDASEIFVVLAGISAVLAYFKRGEGPSFVRPWRRAGRLYSVHLLLFALKALAAGLLLSLASPYALPLDMNGFWSDPLGHLPGVLTLAYLPYNLDILPMYMVLLILAPFAMWLAMRSVVALLIVSALLWLAAGVGHLNLPNGANDLGVWFFDPISWQILLVGGVLLGLRIKEGKTMLPYHPALFNAAGVFCIAAIPIAYLAHFEMIATIFGSHYHEMASKTNVGPLRLINVAALIYLAWNMKWVEDAANSGTFSLLRDAGRHSLAVFATGIALSNLCAVVMKVHPDMPLASQLLSLIIGCGLLLGLGRHLENRRQSTLARQQIDRPRQVAAA
ncbi:OpgC family protein [Rhizobium sp. YIM 134829]|uniref:OpgC family protein n=1 Tax=Rhizobium sp. YIM 134829 TaxID=3390453 RepID=UPI00397B1B46